MLDLSHLIGSSKEQLEIKLSFLLEVSEGFSQWFNNKFMKYGGIADYNDIEVLEESVLHVIKEKLK